MTFASRDFERSVIDSCRLEVRQLRDVKGADRERLMQAVMDSAKRHINNGVHGQRALRKAVREEIREEFGSFILLAVIGAVIHFIVVRLLERLLPKGE